MATITQETLVPFGVAVVCALAIGGWATRTEVTLASHTIEIQSAHKELDEQASKFSEICRLLHNIDNRLSVMESEIKRIRK